MGLIKRRNHDKYCIDHRIDSLPIICYSAGGKSYSTCGSDQLMDRFDVFNNKMLFLFDSFNKKTIAISSSRREKF